MLISNGSITRNITPEQLPEYIVKSYTEVKETEKKPRAKKPKD